MIVLEHVWVHLRKKITYYPYRRFMDGLARTVDLAVAKMRQKKKELRDLQLKNRRLNDEIVKVNAVYAEKMRKLQVELTSLVDCIRQTKPTFLEGVNPSLYYKNELDIRKTIHKLESGLSNMYLFVRAKRVEHPMLDVSKDGSKIIFEGVGVDNPFDQVFQGVDEIETPGLQNFTAFQPKLISDIRENQRLFLSFYGPSGTGKTTMMRQVFTSVWKELQERRCNDASSFMCSTTVKVQQLYVRSRLSNPIPLTAGSDRHEETATGLHELFDLKKVGEHDTVKVYLNNVQMIHSVGCELYKHSRKLYRLLHYLVPDRPELLDKLIVIKGNTYELREDELIKAVAIHNHADLTTALLAENVESFTLYVIAPLKEIIKLCNSTRIKLHRLVSERLAVESEHYHEPNNDFFIKSGGFIPLFWIPYASPTMVEPISRFNTLRECNVPYDSNDSIYLKSGRDGDNVYQTYLHYVKVLLFAPELSPSLESLLGRWRDEHFPQEYYHKIKLICGAVQANVTYDVANQVFSLEGDARQVMYPSNKTAKDMQEDIQKFSFQRSTPQNQDSSRCATIYTFEYTRQHRSTVSDRSNHTITLVDLPGNEDQIIGCNTEGEDNVLCMETRGIRELLRFIRHMMKIKRLKVPVKMRYPSTLFESVFRSIMEPECKVGLLCFAANYDSSPNYPVNMHATLDFVEALTSGKFSCDRMEQQQIVQEMVREEEEYLQKERALAEKTPKKEVADKVGEAGSVNDDEDVTDLVSILPLMPLRTPMSEVRSDMTRLHSLYVEYHVTGLTPESESYDCVFHCTGYKLKETEYFVQMTNVMTILFEYKNARDHTAHRENYYLHSLFAPEKRYGDINTLYYEKDKLTHALKVKGKSSMTFPWNLDNSEIVCTPRDGYITFSLFERSKGAITVQTKDGSFLENDMTVAIYRY